MRKLVETEMDEIKRVTTYSPRPAPIRGGFNNGFVGFASGYLFSDLDPGWVGWIQVLAASNTLCPVSDLFTYTLTTSRIKTKKI